MISFLKPHSLPVSCLGGSFPLPRLQLTSLSCDEWRLTSSNACSSDLQEIIQRANKSMPTPLQDKSEFSLLGCIEFEGFKADSRNNDKLVRFGNGDIKCINSTSNWHLYKCSNNLRIWRCGCPGHDGILEQGKFCAPENTWIKLHCDLSENNNGGAQVIPQLDHLHLNGQIVFELDLHVCSIL